MVVRLAFCLIKEDSGSVALRQKWTWHLRMTRPKTDTKANSETDNDARRQTGNNEEPFYGHAIYSSLCFWRMVCGRMGRWGPWRVSSGPVHFFIGPSRPD